MSTLENGTYSVINKYKEGPQSYIIEIDGNIKLRVTSIINDGEFKDVVSVLIQNDKKSTPIMLRTPYSFVSGCSYEII